MKESVSEKGSPVNFEVDVVELIKLVFSGKDPERNDLLAIVENGTDRKLSVTFANHHGNLAESAGSSDILPVDLTQESPKANVFAVGWEAAGVGCNAFVNIEYSSKRSLALVIATPGNKENYFRYKPYTTASYKKDELYDLVESTCGKHKSSGGTLEKDLHDGLRFKIWITNTSPADCRIEILQQIY